MCAEATIGVLMNPGQIALTWIPRGASSTLSDSVNPTIACFEVQ
jgi:hypothetical protein